MANKTVKGSPVVLICDEQGCASPPLYACKCEWCNKRKHVEDKYFSCHEHLANNTQRHGANKKIIPIWFKFTPVKEVEREYDVHVTAHAVVRGVMRVKAPTPGVAKAKAQAALGDVKWEYVELCEPEDLVFGSIALVE